MADIKRPNYFTSQFLVEKDFNDEQAYHLNTRRRLNRVLHTVGVAEGLDVTRVGPTQVRVGVGTAIDRDGREIVVDDARTYTLTTNGSDLDVNLTISYQEVFDPADHYTQAGLDKFTRTTERSLLQDSTAAPPTDGSAILLARIRLNRDATIDSTGSINTAVRTIATARIAPKAITSAQLADGSVTAAKLAPDAVPTAAQIDTFGGANRLVAQINAGTGVIVRSRLESTVVSGVVTFQNLAAGVEMFSNDIDPGFGPGALSVQLALDDVPAVNLAVTGDTNYARTVQFRSEVNRATGRFRIFVTRNATSTTGSVAVRWHAFKPQAGVDTIVGIGVTVSPNPVTLVNNNTQVFTAAVANTNSTGVTWSTEQNGGTVSPTTGATTTYTPPGISGTYLVSAISAADTSKKGTATVIVNADITVILNQLTATVFRGATLSLSATVVNTPTTGVTWSIDQGAAGGSLASTGNSTVYTAPLAPGTYTVRATSNADGNKKGTCTITVPAATIALTTPSAITVFRGTTAVIGATVGNSVNTSVNWSILQGGAGGSVSPATGSTTTYTAPLAPGPYTVVATSASDQTKTVRCDINVPPVTIVIAADSSTVTAGSSTVIRATITGTNDNRANWFSESSVPSVSPAIGNTTTFRAPNVGGFFGVRATAVSDTNQSHTVNITVPNVKTTEGGGGGKFAANEENITAARAIDMSEPAASPDEQAEKGTKGRSFVRPKKRSEPKLPPEPGDG